VKIEKNKTFLDKISDFITDFSGSELFIFLHIIWFSFWLVYNLIASQPFDPYPFGLLTLVVSLEAIFLATFILISQNKTDQINDIRSELDYQTDIKSEKNTAEVLALLKKIYSLSKKDKK